MPSIGKSYKSNLERAQFGMVEIFPGACPERKISRHFAPRNDRNEGGKRTKRNKITNLLSEMAKKDTTIKNTGSDKKPNWILT